MKKLILLPGGVFALLLLGFLLMPRAGDEKVAAQGIEQRAAQLSARVPSDAPNFALIPSSDLPPEGTRSLFDHLISQEGSLPFPFDRVLAMLAAQDEQGRMPHTLLIPDGRSLLKGHATFARPRMVVAADAQPPLGADLSPLFKGRLFLGFVEDAQEIEVISYNESAGRYEFQLVENYCEGCVPRIVYAQRAVCTTCHAGAAPIFPVRPWEETNVQPEIYQRIVAQMNLSAEDGQYYGAPLKRRLDDAQSFDNLTDIANVLPVVQRIWIDGCGVDGAECRRSLLKLALNYAMNPSLFDNDPAASQELTEAQSRAWPAAGIALANSDLSNRNPMEQGLYDDSFGAQVLRLLRPKREAAHSSGDKLKDFDQLPALPAEFDPLTPRAPRKVIQPTDLDGVLGIAQMFAPSDIQELEALAGYQAEVIAEAVAELDPQLFEAGPLRRVEIVNSLRMALGADAKAYCCTDVSAMSAPIAQGEPPLELSEGSVLHPFEQYCFACHRGNPQARLDFMSGPDEAVVLNNIQVKTEITEALDYERYQGTRKAGQLMPPADSWQREALERAIAQGQDPLTTMREQIPSLFDF